MRLLFVTPFYKPAYVYGGPTRSIPALCEALASLGCEVTVFATNANGSRNFTVDEEPQTSMVDGVRVYYFNRDIPGSFFYSQELGKACNQMKEKFDLVYISSNWAYPFIPSCRLAHAMNIPYVVSPRTSFMQRTWRGKYLKKKIYHELIERSLINHASALHYTTSLEVQESAWLKLKPDYFIQPNPVQMGEFDYLPAKGIFRNKNNIQSDERTVLYLGRIEPRKGIDILIYSFEHMSRTIQNAKLVLAGSEEDDYKKKLFKIIDTLKIRDKVIFTGFLGPGERLEAFVDANVFALTSYSENFGMSVVEAMAAGLPVVISDRVGLAEDIQHENAGLVVPLEVDKISYALNQLLMSSELRHSLGTTAIQFAREKYTPSKVAQAVLGEFTRILT